MFHHRNCMYEQCLYSLAIIWSCQIPFCPEVSHTFLPPSSEQKQYSHLSPNSFKAMRENMRRLNMKSKKT